MIFKLPARRENRLAGRLGRGGRRPRPCSWSGRPDRRLPGAEQLWFGLRGGGSLVVLLVWIYYSSQILFFGAEFTKVYADRYGKQIKPAADAEPVTTQARAQQGIPKGHPEVRG